MIALGVDRRRSLVPALLALVAAACGGADEGTDVPTLGRLEITAQPGTLAVRPNESSQILFQLRDLHGGAPAPDRILRFLIVDPDKARGATLGVDRGITDSRGQFALPVVAGLATNFVLRASALSAGDVEVPVLVDPARHGPVEVVPEVQAEDALQTRVTSVRLFFVPGVACANSSPGDLALSGLRPEVLPAGMSALYPTVNAEQNHAIFGQGTDSTGEALVDGCVDFPGRAVEAQVVARVLLPLRPLRASIAGSFLATSILRFQQMPKAVSALAEVWNEAFACPADPGRLWLDCTIDALTSTSGDDPLDCRPGPTDDAAFDGRLAARRGLRIDTSPGGRCRGTTDGAGRPAIEAQVQALLDNATAAALINHLGVMAREARSLLHDFKVHSTIALRRTTAPDRFQLDHTLEALELTVLGEPVVVDLLGLGLPGRSARFVPCSTDGDELKIAGHGFTLRLGTAARLGFERGTLARQAYPTTIEAFVAALFSAASLSSGGTTTSGCAAMDALICPGINAPAGCLTDACKRGTAALGKRLADAFAGLDGDELDLVLGGSVSIFDRDGDGRADALGLLLPAGASDPGVWSGQLRTSAEQTPLSGFWTADRVP
jgi:hypothetical protein